MPYCKECKTNSPLDRFDGKDPVLKCGHIISNNPIKVSGYKFGVELNALVEDGMSIGQAVIALERQSRIRLQKRLRRT
jgi:hypothetical protein